SSGAGTITVVISCFVGASISLGRRVYVRGWVSGSGRLVDSATETGDFVGAGAGGVGTAASGTSTVLETGSRSVFFGADAWTVLETGNSVFFGAGTWAGIGAWASIGAWTVAVAVSVGRPSCSRSSAPKPVALAGCAMPVVAGAVAAASWDVVGG